MHFLFIGTTMRENRGRRFCPIGSHLPLFNFQVEEPQVVNTFNKLRSIREQDLVTRLYSIQYLSWNIFQLDVAFSALKCCNPKYIFVNVGEYNRSLKLHGPKRIRCQVQLWFESKREGFSRFGACQAMSLCKILRVLYSLGLLCLIRFHINLGSIGSKQSDPHEEVITVLSIDGGGVRGIIASIVLSYLESILQAKRDESMDPPLSDVCIATSAAPCYFPPHLLTASAKEFHLVDGGVAANNPSLLAVCEVIKEKKVDYSKILLLSLGTGEQKGKDKLEVGEDPSKWGILNWLWQNDNSNPLLDILMSSADEMIEMYMSSIFQSRGLSENYLRIQADLSYVEAALDDSSDENLNRLLKIGEDLVEKNEDILTYFAERLVDIRKARSSK
ncbi:hypothetical protein NC652_040681 [Populus alba x Populus x berolinensis]|nr:hypothetical protein NC652_040681 [Populus alba x Populus x berolinensis]